MATLTPSPKMEFFDNNGDPLVGGKLYTYISGTTTPVFTKTDATGTVNNTNPVILDARGEASVWLDESVIYRFVLKTSTDVEIWTSDGITGFLTPITKGQFRFTTNGSFTVPVGVTKLWVSGVAGGGSGGGGGSNAIANAIAMAGGGGGGGQSVYKKLLTVVPGEVIPITVGLGGLSDASHGQGGTSGADDAMNGANGTDTIIGTYVTLTHGDGGRAGKISAGTIVDVFTDGAGGSGGSGGVGGALIDGQAGKAGSPGGPTGGHVVSSFGGDGGSSLYGMGGHGPRITIGLGSGVGGSIPKGYGAGGPGGGVAFDNPSSGGTGVGGTDGMVLIEW